MCIAASHAVAGEFNQQCEGKDVKQEQFLKLADKRGDTWN
jgi:hypothetical protein